jgi:carbonic anhydrase
MQLFSDEIIRDLLRQSLSTASFDGSKWTDPATGGGSRAGELIDWLTFKDLAESVAVDVERIRQHSLVPTTIPIHGFIYDVTNGRLVEVPRATELGRSGARHT